MAKSAARSLWLGARGGVEAYRLAYVFDRDYCIGNDPSETPARSCGTLRLLASRARTHIDVDERATARRNFLRLWIFGGWRNSIGMPTRYA